MLFCVLLKSVAKPCFRLAEADPLSGPTVSCSKLLYTVFTGRKEK